jgi:3-dehydroquinate synthetase
MAVAARIAESLGLLSLEEEARLVGLLEKMGLPTRIPGVAASLLVAALRSDKKAIGGVPRFSLPAGLGRVEPGYEVETGALERLLVEMGAGG